MYIYTCTYVHIEISENWLFVEDIQVVIAEWSLKHSLVPISQGEN